MVLKTQLLQLCSLRTQQGEMVSPGHPPNSKKRCSGAWASKCPCVSGALGKYSYTGLANRSNPGLCCPAGKPSSASPPLRSLGQAAWPPEASVSSSMKWDYARPPPPGAGLLGALEYVYALSLTHRRHSNPGQHDLALLHCLLSDLTSHWS